MNATRRRFVQGITAGLVALAATPFARASGLSRILPVDVYTDEHAWPERFKPWVLEKYRIERLAFRRARGWHDAYLRAGYAAWDAAPWRDCATGRVSDGQYGAPYEDTVVAEVLEEMDFLRPS